MLGYLVPLQMSSDTSPRQSAQSLERLSLSSAAGTSHIAIRR
jgi:hypothetical protein